MLTCKQVTELVTDFVEGRMSLYEQMRFRMHIAMCKHCRTFIDQMKQTVEVVGAMPTDVDVPPDVRDSLSNAFAEWNAERQADSEPNE